jgi:hypothetical protein
MIGRRAGRGWGYMPAIAGTRAAGQAGYLAALTASLPAALARPHPALWLSLLTACWAAPGGVVRLTGASIDAWGPRRVGSVCWGICGLAAAVPAVLSHAGMPAIAVVLAVTGLSAGTGVAAGEAAPTWLPSRPDPAELARAGTWLAAAADLTVGAGPLGAAALTAVGERPAWLLATAFCAAATALSASVPAIPPRETASKHKRSARSPTSTRIALVATIAIFTGYGIITILEALYVRQDLHAPYLAYGCLLAVWAAAGALTAMVANRHPRLMIGSRALPLSASVIAVGEALFISTSWLAVSAIGSAVYGVGSALFYMSCRTILLDTVPSGRHGRVLAAWWSVQAICIAGPALLAGTLVIALGLRAVLGIAPALAAVTAAVAVVAPRRTWAVVRA